MSSTQELGLKIAYGALMTMAVVPIYVGSYASLACMKRPRNAPKKKKSTSPLEDSDDEDAATETLSAQDAWMFPVIGSGVLFSLYLVFRYVDKAYIDMMITVYFGLMGTLAVAKTALLFAQKTVPLALLKPIKKYKMSIACEGKDVYRLSFSVVHFVLLALGGALTVYYTYTKQWIVSNTLGLSFSINALQLLNLDSFNTGMILLSGLFVYDVFWVFGTEVMVTVAKGFDAPIKVIWPRDIIAFCQGNTDISFAMLGLGDIVIPGIFVALCLRFDRHQSWNKSPSGDFRATSFSKPYFTACMIAYVLGLATTMGVMHFFKAAQPALLYLSPACILSVLLTALARGELSEVLKYVAEEDDEKAKDEKKKKTKKDRSRSQSPAAKKTIAEEKDADDTASSTATPKKSASKKKKSK
ncbi:signal peptide peptidase-domain-containing protein [Gongronella butleri]|nr:signal peptide peptidase-domain-containing protein [Gongronella butleri]